MSRGITLNGEELKRLATVVNACAEKYDSFYLYDESIISDNIRELKENFPQIDFLYSIKCNSNPYVLKSIFSQRFGADAASAGEVKLAHTAGLTAGQIYYSAPGKSIQEIESTIDNAVLIADSINEIKKIQSVAEAEGKIAKIGIRINPNFSFKGSNAMPSKFGIDENQALEFIRSESCKNIRISGIHVHLKSQELNAETLAVYYKKILQLARRFAEVLGELEYVNMGLGMGIQYSPTDLSLDVVSLGKVVHDSLNKFNLDYPNTRMMIEVGRYAVCKSGIYVTKVMDRKVSYGRTYIILKNTLNGFLRPSMAKLIEHYSSDESPAGSEPLFTSIDAFEIIPLKETDSREIVTNAGSYAAVLSPVQFSTQEKPQEFFVTKSGDVLAVNSRFVADKLGMTRKVSWM